MSKGNDFQATLDMRELLLLTGGIRREVECIGVEILPVTSIIAIHHPTYGRRRKSAYRSDLCARE
ncbi:hypothetical protein DBV08_07600 [Rhodococcus sp. KBW08]|nr:hypothetical protein DBV08_07600 [Rhodococcus sp. KBW08]